MNATPYILLHGYRANLDLTPIIAAQRSPLPIDELTEDETEQLEKLKLRKKKTYFDNNVINLLVSCACKEEVTRNKAYEMMKKVLLVYRRDITDICRLPLLPTTAKEQDNSCH